MKTALITFCIVLFSSLSVAAQATGSDTSAVHHVIRQVFESFSNGKLSLMERHVTSDVNILEQGVVWNLDSIRTYFSRPRPDDFRRINKLKFFQTEVRGEMAFVSYHNTAEIHARGRDRTVKWLESAVLTKERGQWKVKMLHSTRKE